jgi:protein-S-isoprenylcysteine O-methyltransferase Ste14
VKGLGSPAPIDAPINLVVNGLYRFVRNPVYVGVFLLIASRAVLFWSLPIVLYLALVATCVQLFIVLYEEPHLCKIFGEQYLEYCRRVPRWIPRLRAAQ